MGKNGSYKNGSGKDKDDSEKILSFPTLAERDRLRQQKEALEKSIRAEYAKKKNPPFLNLDKIPLVIKILLPLMVAIHVILHLGLDDAGILTTYSRFGFVPFYYSSVPEIFMIFGPFTHIFLHGSWMHLAINTLMLTALGTFFIREYGTKTMLVYFLVCAIGGAIFYGLINPFSRLPLIGASGGISGLFAGILLVIYKNGTFYKIKLVRKHGFIAVCGLWIALNLIITLILGGGGHSWEAHTGGFIAGIFMLSYFKRKDLKFWRL
jgi:membrane associated rhomboid family serine protease